MVVEYARFLGHDKAVSGEWTNDPEWLMENSAYKDHPLAIVDILPDQTDRMGGTMRLGNHNIVLDDTSKLYRDSVITERRRHRYELTVKNASLFAESPLKVVGTDVTHSLVELVTLVDHPYYVGCQYHPEFRSRFNRPHPLFVHLLSA